MVLRLTAPAALLAALGASVAAMDSHIVGPRALGMGGAGTAAAADHNASFWNPALYGWFSMTNADDGPVPADPNFIGRKDWGIGLIDLGVSAQLQGQLADWVDRLSEADVARLQDLGTARSNPRDVEWAMVALDAFNRFVPDRDFVSAQTHLGVLNIRAWRLGIGARMYTEAVVGLTDVDRYHIGFGTNTPWSPAQDINRTPMPPGYTSGYQPVLIPASSASYQVLFTALGGGADAEEAIKRLDYAARQAGLTKEQVDALIANGSGLLITAIHASAYQAPTSIANNTTAATAIAFSVVEVPLTIGWPIGEHLAIGGSAKLLAGEVGAVKVRLARETNDFTQYIRDSMETVQQTVTGSVDLGVAARWGWGQAGLTGRNLTFPTLKGGRFQDADGKWFRVDDIELTPQLAFGVALYPFETLCFTADIDLTENRTKFRTVSERTDLPASTARELSFETASQRLALGAEWDILRFLALRGGASYDLADPEPTWMWHAGVGLNLWLIRADVGAAVSSETMTINGEEYPRAFAVSAGVAIDF